MSEDFPEKFTNRDADVRNFLESCFSTEDNIIYTLDKQSMQNIEELVFNLNSRCRDLETDINELETELGDNKVISGWSFMLNVLFIGLFLGMLIF